MAFTLQFALAADSASLAASPDPTQEEENDRAALILRLERAAWQQPDAIPRFALAFVLSRSPSGPQEPRVLDLLGHLAQRLAESSETCADAHAKVIPWFLNTHGASSHALYSTMMSLQRALRAYACPQPHIPSNEELRDDIKEWLRHVLRTSYLSAHHAPLYSLARRYEAEASERERQPEIWPLERSAADAIDVRILTLALFQRFLAAAHEDPRASASRVAHAHQSIALLRAQLSALRALRAQQQRRERAAALWPRPMIQVKAGALIGVNQLLSDLCGAAACQRPAASALLGVDLDVSLRIVGGLKMAGRVVSLFPAQPACGLLCRVVLLRAEAGLHYQYVLPVVELHTAVQYGLLSLWLLDDDAAIGGRWQAQYLDLALGLSGRVRRRDAGPVTLGLMAHYHLVLDARVAALPARGPVDHGFRLDLTPAGMTYPRWGWALHAAYEFFSIRGRVRESLSGTVQEHLTTLRFEVIPK